MKVIKYQFMTEVDYGTPEKPDVRQIFTKAQVPYSEKNMAFAQAEAYNGEVTVEDIPDTRPIEEVRESKLNELSNACDTTINSGTQVQLSDGSTESFTYDLADQSNVSEMFNAVLLGATEYPYHANDDDCRMYSAQDIMAIYATLSSYKTMQITYHNQLKQYVKSLETTEEVSAVTYGQELTGVYLDKYNELMVQAKAQLDTIISKVQANEATE